MEGKNGKMKKKVQHIIFIIWEKKNIYGKNEKFIWKNIYIGFFLFLSFLFSLSLSLSKIISNFIHILFIYLLDLNNT